MKHCMMDLETWGTKPGAALRSIGAVMFELDGAIGQRFYRNINLDSQIKDGHALLIDPRTQEWWDRQSDEAKRLLEVGQRPIQEVIAQFHQGFLEAGGMYIWSHGSSFDVILWQYICDVFDIKVPWNHRNIRDTRTWYDAHEFEKPKFEGTKHYALDDALHQTRCVQAAHASRHRTPQEEEADMTAVVQALGPTTSFTLKGRT